MFKSTRSLQYILDKWERTFQTKSLEAFGMFQFSILMTHMTLLYTNQGIYLIKAQSY